MQRQPRITRSRLSKTAVGVLIVLGLACERSSPPPAGRKDTAVQKMPPPESTITPAPVVSLWDSTAGPALFVMGATPHEALVIEPPFIDASVLDSVSFDPTPVRSLALDLFGSGKKVGTARVAALAAGSPADSCRTWPTARLELAPGDTTAPPQWNVAFEAGHALELAVDSIEGLTTVDSARLAADVARIASALPGDTAAAFRGLPFVVNKAWRARTPNGQTILSAIVVRNVNQEASPRQERILLIAQRDSGAVSSRFTPQYWERVVGLEETLESADPIAIVLLGEDRYPTVVIARDAGRGISYGLIERKSGRWERRWTSAYAGC